MGVRESLKMVLGKEFRLIEADSVDIALERVAEARPDLVLLDLIMPKSDGLVVLQRIKEIHPGCAVMENGAFDFIGKPFDVVDLRQKVARGIEHVAANNPPH
jgi:DNA-binding NtrC family response regulator